jgi:hypothetical protein
MEFMYPFTYSKSQEDVEKLVYSKVYFHNFIYIKKIRPITYSKLYSATTLHFLHACRVAGGMLFSFFRIFLGFFRLEVKHVGEFT